ncbi:hypothetical protein TcG_06620 [Trypanosoma cruzi]|uniref:FHA domain-containing protein n=1 Tax=Trypanosoma cruzi Dm28c TaxID=1416333 RepID=V5BXW8_TRYCR|nr:hypothetical protein TCDM_01927 [Trypanosoma cruzi Dm28c]RNF16048.1 hypothetical protein TcG_06620 [Trypanosoma cruzi]
MLQATFTSFVASLPNCGVAENKENTVDYDDDDRATILACDEGSDAETCSTHTALLSDDYDDTADALCGAKDGAASDAEVPHCGGSQPPRSVSNALNKHPRASVPFLEVCLVPSTTPLRPEGTERELTEFETVGFPQLCTYWEMCECAERSRGVRQFLIPAKDEVWWGSAAAPPPSARLTCVYQVGRSDIPAAVGGLNVPQSRCSVSRVHCEVRLHFRLMTNPLAQDHNATAPSGPIYSWNSFDVVDCSSSNGTFYHAVRLLPSHRYTFSVKNGVGSVELMLGDHYRLRIQADGIPSVASEEIPTGHHGATKLLEKFDAEVQWTFSPIIRVARRVPSQSRRPPKKPVAVAKSRSRAKCRKQVSFKSDVEPFIQPPCGGAELESNGKLRIVTTGLRLTSAKETKLRRLGIVMNPPRSEFGRAKVLVIDGPLMRSVKLLTALPFVEHIVDRAWLDAVLALPLKISSETTTSTTTRLMDFASFPYSERRTRRSIETVNAFSLQELIQVPACQRQALFAGQLFWVHPEAEPQDPPDNDLKYVILASGGALTKDASCATVAVMPQVNVTSSMWGQAYSCPQEPLCIFIVPNDLFCAVLQQRRLTTSTVRCPVGVSVLPPSPTTAMLREKRCLSSPRESTKKSKSRRK